MAIYLKSSEKVSGETVQNSNNKVKRLGEGGIEKKKAEMEWVYWAR